MKNYTLLKTLGNDTLYHTFTLFIYDLILLTLVFIVAFKNLLGTGGLIYVFKTFSPIEYKFFINSTSASLKLNKKILLNLFHVFFSFLKKCSNLIVWKPLFKKTSYLGFFASHQNKNKKY